VVILLATTPVNFIHSRLLLDNLYPVPFVIAWLLCLLKYFEGKKIWVLLAGLFLLGAGMYTYHAARIMMPFYFLLTLLVVRRNYLKLSLAFAAPLAPLIWWFSKYPDTLFADQVKYTGIYKLNLFHRLDVYLNYFNPKFLFFTGDQSLIHSTHRSGVFLIPLLIFIPVGIYFLWKKKDTFNRLLLAGFFTSPIAATIAGDHYRISRALFILPFATLIAVAGLKALLSVRDIRWKLTCIFLVLLIPLQFAVFYYDYMTKYRVRSYSWFNDNIPGVLESTISYVKENQVEQIYLDRRVNFIDRYWKFYTLRANTPELLSKAVYQDPYSLVLETMPEKSLIVYNFNHIDGQKKTLGPFKKVKEIIEPDGVSKFYLFAN